MTRPEGIAAVRDAVARRVADDESAALDARAYIRGVRDAVHALAAAGAFSDGYDVSALLTEAGIR